MISIMTKNYKLYKLENGPSKACSNHYHHDLSMILHIFAENLRQYALAAGCAFGLIFWYEKNK